MVVSNNFIPTESATHTPLVAYASSGNIITDPIPILYATNFALTAFWTNSGTGTFTLQGCTDKERVQLVADGNLVNWVTLGLSSQPTSAVSPLMWNYSNAGYRWLRLVYTVATGSITLSATIQIKGL